MHPPATSPASSLTTFLEALDGFRAATEGALRRRLERKRLEAWEIAAETAPLFDDVAALVLSGGKRLRPALVHHAFLACGGRNPAEAEPLALATELLHTYLLIHDDIMDHADTRRGLPTVHAAFSARHRQAGFRGDGADYGRSMAILAGDLAASYAFELAAETQAPPERKRALEATFAAMAQEVVLGQYLEIRASVAGPPSEDELLRVLRLKSGRYSVERPIELGALLAAAGPEQRAALAIYGRVVGEAFQLKDDLLGVFGEAAATGKSVSGDLAEGKHTFLVHFALRAAALHERAFLGSALGNPALGPDEAAEIRRIFVRSGAVGEVEGMIGSRLAEAREALAAAAFVPAGGEFLAGLIDYSELRLG